jgi:proline racemase
MSVATVDTIDTHTLGEPTRIVLSGFPALRGSTLKERSRDLLRRHMDMVRSLMWEPRGHAFMFGAIVTPPVAPGADLSLVFMDGGGAVEMCVHGTIGAVTALVETGRLEVGSDGIVVVDTPAAPVKVRVRGSRRRVTGVELEGVPSRSIATGLLAQIGDRDVRYDLAYGGNLVALIAARDAGVKVEARNFAALVEAGMRVKKQAQRRHRGVVSALIYARIGSARYRDLVVFRDHSVDRSPCGSCVSALMAQLVTTGRLAPDDWIECENLLGLAFRARVVERNRQLVPQLSGSAFITGEHRFRIDSRDPLRHGFQLA